jgi:hypothetical protein
MYRITFCADADDRRIPVTAAKIASQMPCPNALSAFSLWLQPEAGLRTVDHGFGCADLGSAVRTCRLTSMMDLRF